MLSHLKHLGSLVYGNVVSNTISNPFLSEVADM